MAKRLTDSQKQQIIADYIERGSYRDTARKHSISEGTVRRLIKINPENTQIYAQKKRKKYA